MEILKGKKIYHVIKHENGTDEIKSVSEEMITDDSGFEVTQIISSRLCSCGREVGGTDKIYACQSCRLSQKMCSACAFQCACGRISCYFCSGFLNGKVYCLNCWQRDAERMFREKHR